MEEEFIEEDAHFTKSAFETLNHEDDDEDLFSQGFESDAESTFYEEEDDF